VLTIAFWFVSPLLQLDGSFQSLLVPPTHVLSAKIGIGEAARSDAMLQAQRASKKWWQFRTCTIYDNYRQGLGCTPKNRIRAVSPIKNGRSLKR
jgi:hypothetical protein